MIVDKRITLLCILLCVTSLFFTITNFVPLSMLFSCLVPIVPLLLFLRRQYNILQLYVIIMLLYFFFHVVCYNYSSLFEYQFYRYDGNVFFTFLPLVICGCISMSINIKKIVSYFLIITTIINSICIMFFILNPFRKPLYHFLFIAHNAAGGFLGVICAISIGYYVQTKAKSYLVITIVNLIGLLITYSRGSILGLFAAVIGVLFLKKHGMKILILLYLVMITCLMSFTYPTWKNSEKVSIYISRQIATKSSQNSFGIDDYNIIDRCFLLWPRAFYLWTRSPIVGIGFGGYNDIPYNLKCKSFLFSWNIPSYVTYSSAHAHHTYLHLLAETGILGLFLLFLVMYQMHKFINEKIDFEPLKLGLLLAFWMSAWSSVTEHRFFTPAQMLPFNLILGLCITRYQAKKIQHN